MPVTTELPFDLLDQALLAAGEAAPDTVEELLALPKMKIFSGALKAYEGPNGQRTFRCTASSTLKDLHGDIMDEECVRDMAMQAKRGPTSNGLTIFLNHRYNVPEDVAGKVLDAGVLTRMTDQESGLPIWDMDYEVQLAQNSGRLDQVWSLIKDEQITLGISIGAYILEYDFIDKDEGFWGGLIIHRVLLVETSIVGIPANQRSWVQNGVEAIAKHIGLKTLFNTDEPEFRLEKQLRRVLDGKEARPMTLKTASVDGIVKTGIEVPADGTTTITLTDDGKLPLENLLELADKAANPTPEAEADVVSAEAPEAAPESESTAETAETTTATDSAEEPAKADLAAVVPEVALSLEAGVTPAAEILLLAVEKAAGQVADLRTRAAALEAQIVTLTGERDVAKKDADDAAALVEAIARQPLGRKATIEPHVESFRARFAGIYDDAFLEHFDKNKE